MPRCHFVYAVPPEPARNLAGRLVRRARHELNARGIPVTLVRCRTPDGAALAQWPRRSPYANTRHIYEALAERIPTFLYHLTERVRCRLASDDVFLGHPVFPYTAHAAGVTEVTAASAERGRKFALITPLHCDVAVATNHINRAFLDHVGRLLPRADVLFAIMGEYWWDAWDQSPYAHWKPKMVRLDMAVDTRDFPQVKRSFRAAGDRGFLFIAPSDDARKGADILSRLAAAVPDARFGWIGSGPDIPNVPRVSAARPLTPEFMEHVARDFDVFLSVARADPNPTTILEAMSWGFPVLSTLESGYYPTEFRLGASCRDEDALAALVRRANALPGSDLARMSQLGRQSVERDYTWERMTDCIVRELGL